MKSISCTIDPLGIEFETMKSKMLKFPWLWNLKDGHYHCAQKKGSAANASNAPGQGHILSCRNTLKDKALNEKRATGPLLCIACGMYSQVEHYMMDMEPQVVSTREREREREM